MVSSLSGVFSEIIYFENWFELNSPKNLWFDVRDSSADLQDFPFLSFKTEIV